MTALARAAFIAALMMLAGAATAIVAPGAGREAVAAPDLEALLPEAFGVWRRVPLADAVLPAEAALGPGEAVAYRAYADDLGRIVTLVAAYGPPLGDSVRLHRPETCYRAQGFAIIARKVGEAGDIPVVNLDAQSSARREAVTYWLREGADFSVRAADSQWRRLTRRRAAAADGALVRVSSISADRPQFDLHAEFLSGFTAALDPEARRLLAGEGL
ncbi:MAG TPA: EpsI family protein [Parvularcula sp.]|nr:EpsI family protein [Parvularcula sp.]HBS30845.1 EpsI family protein [Parvularcula sp.]HBS35464.1 EpsI family protein [Parvularcula sp.]